MITLSYFENLYGQSKRTSSDSQYIFNCPSCQKRKLYVYLNSGTSYCFRCGEWKHYKNGETYSIDSYRNSLYRRPDLPDFVSEVSVPDTFSSLKLSLDTDFYTQYIMSRGFSISDFDRVGILFGRKNTKHYRTLLLPVYMTEKLVYYTLRTLYPRPGFYLNPPLDIGTKKSCVLFNFDVARISSSVVVCEGVFDAMTVGLNAVATLGKLISKTQLDLIANNWKTVIMALDPDAYEENYKYYFYFRNLGKIVKILDLNGYKDANQAGREIVSDRLYDLEFKDFNSLDAFKYRTSKLLKKFSVGNL